MNHRVIVLLASMLCLVSRHALAHPGHGDTDPDSWRHYLTEPVHVVVLAAALAAVVVAIFFARAGYRARRDARAAARATAPVDR